MAEKEDVGVQEITIDKEGPIQLYDAKKKKWKTKWGVLSGGAFYYRDKKKDPELNGPVLLKGATIGNNEDHKKKIALQIVLSDDIHILAFEDDGKKKEWMAALEDNKNKEVGGGSSQSDTSGKKKQSTSMRIKKNVSSGVATSSAGKSLIKEFLGKDGVKLLDLVRKIVTLQDGKKKADEVENDIIRVAVKVILLWKNKDLTTQDLAGTIPGVKAIWSDVIDFCEMSFAYDPAKIKEHGEHLSVSFTKLLADYITEKNLVKMREVINYLVTKELLDKLFSDEGQDESKKELNRILRGGWITVFKNDKQ